MKSSFKNLTREEDAENEKIHLRSKTRWLAALFISSVLGIMSGIFGLIISGLNVLGVLSRGEGSGRLGTWMIAVAIPLVLFSRHCLGRVDKNDKALKKGRGIAED